MQSCSHDSKAHVLNPEVWTQSPKSSNPKQGGDVVHISSGVSGLVAAVILGKRRAFSAGEEMPPHNVLLTNAPKP